MSGGQVWEDRAAMVGGWIGSVFGATFFGLVAAGFVTDCSDLNPTIEIGICLGRFRLAAEDNPVAIVGGFAIGLGVAQAVALLFRSLGRRADERVQCDEAHRLAAELESQRGAGGAPIDGQVDEHPDELERWLAASRRAEAREAERARQKSELPDSGETDE